MRKGYVQIYTGDGKGKTTAALGLGLRAVGRGLRVIMVQFLKGRFTGELESIKHLAPNFQIVRLAETEKFFNQMTEEEKTGVRQRFRDELEKLHEYMGGGGCDILILDEVMGAIKNGLISVHEVCSIIDNKPPSMELILTGRGVPDPIALRADLITEMKNIKHYADRGVPARKGIEL